ncbi:hypothetical protein Dsin_017386 [Dipteronia sinensis]|uniref:MULE transposase domain-containing protein n=1 Tax=Dipteronia sinensis TaxID=43782 RepID=A0AAE0AGC0_9ROSI|nr:hypothetical protein Dsin_017386 [Dipteronia sinensis]
MKDQRRALFDLCIKGKSPQDSALDGDLGDRGNGFGIKGKNLDYDNEGRVLRRKWKDMYNKIAKMRRSKAFESDSQAAISYLESKAYSKQKFCYKFIIDDADRLANIFSRDSHSLVEYNCFRDVLVFDITYKTNAYGKPLVLFVGANNHSPTCVFATTFFLDKTFTSYKWALTKLMDLMGSKHPLSIMTDGDEAM